MNQNKEHQAKKQLFNLGKKAGKKTLQTANNTRKYIIKKIAKKLGLSIGVASIFSFFIAIIIMVVVMVIINNSSDDNNLEIGFELSPQVEAYTQTIEFYANKHNISEYVPLIKAIMQVESAGKGNDPMQCSESPFNTKYPQRPNSIQEPTYSIDVGCQYLAYCLQQSGTAGMTDIEKIKLTAQGYNYGNGYISWALSKYGGYSKENALEFSQMKQQELDWNGYGDPEYVTKVIKYLPNQNQATGVPHQDIVNIALQEVGNNYSKYGLSSHWCGAFVSWCAKQSNIPQTQIKTYYFVLDGINWFKQQGRFMESYSQGGNYIPNIGDIIFINWKGILGSPSNNHTGIVTKVENGRVYTVEGNTNGYGSIFWNTSVVSTQSYPLNSRVVTGYGIYN